MKKEWTAPEITCLNVEETNGGSVPNIRDNYAISGDDLNVGS